VSENSIVIASYDALWPDRAATLIEQLAATLERVALLFRDWMRALARTTVS
jgi:hypothetical protein